MGIRVLIADDHPLFLYGLRSALEAVSTIDVVGEATSGTAVIALANTLKPDVIIMDLNMPGVSGIEATRRIVAADASIRVLVLTMFSDDESMFSAIRAGARGYLLKGADPDDIVRAVHAVAESEAVFGPAIASRLLTFVATAIPPRPEAFPELSDREREILWLIARGENNASIARRLVLSPKTVRNHVSNIYRKLNVSNRAQAAARVREAGLRDWKRDSKRDESGTSGE
jgi:DNA-binding NarL/FixJ family response regulator